MMVTVPLDSPSCEVTLFDPVYWWFIGTLPDRPRDYTVWSTLEPLGVDSRTWAGIIQVGSATAWILFSSSFPLRNKHLYCNCNVESFWVNQGLFLFFTNVAISPFVIRAWTPYLSLLHTHPQFQIACLYFLACVLRFACRISLLGEVNQVVLGW
jgi:hypothetical protein